MGIPVAVTLVCIEYFGYFFIGIFDVDGLGAYSSVGYGCDE